MSSVLAKLDAVKSLLAQIETVPDAKVVRDKAEALRAVAKKVGYGLEAQNTCAEIKLRAERLGGELLKDQGFGEHGGDRRSTSMMAVELADLGVDEHQSSRWQLEASVPEEQFEQYVTETCEAGKELTSIGLIRLGARLRVVEEHDVPPPTGKYRCLVIDPPWPVEKIERDDRPLQGKTLDYSSWTLERIIGLTLPADEKGCHVYLWRTHKWYGAALDILNA